MDIDVLKTFLAITETGSFTLAGDRVGRTQGAVSQQIKRLEEEIGRAVLTRSPAGVDLTEDGQRLLPYARDILGAHDRALAAFGKGIEETGTIVLGMPEVYAEAVLPRILPRFQALYPGVAVHLVLRDSLALLRMLRDGAVDLSFVTESESGDLSGPLVFEEHPVWVAPRGQVLEALDPLPIVTWREGTNYRQEVTGALDRVGRAYRIAVSTQSVGGIVTSVAAGLGIAAMTARNATRALRIIGPEAGLPQLPTLRVRLERGAATGNRLARAFEAHVAEVFGVSGA